MKLDISKYGFVDGLVSGAKVVVWVAASAAVAGLIAYVSNYHPTETQYATVAIVAASNGALVWLKQWLQTHEPK